VSGGATDAPRDTGWERAVRGWECRMRLEERVDG